MSCALLLSLAYKACAKTIERKSGGGDDDSQVHCILEKLLPADGWLSNQ
jgi:hypothetical protein